MMRPKDDRDPPRWRHNANATETTNSSNSIGATIRAIPTPIELDDVRLAHIRQRIAQERVPATRPLAAGGAWSRVRTTAFALGFVLLGSLATAGAAGLYIRQMKRTTAPARAAVEPRERSAAQKVRRWRVAVRAPADLELSFAPTGAELAVVEGQAEVTSAQLPSAVLLTPGTSLNQDDVTPSPPRPQAAAVAASPRAVAVVEAAAVTPVAPRRTYGLPRLAEASGTERGARAHPRELPAPPAPPAFGPNPSSSLAPPAFQPSTGAPGPHLTGVGTPVASAIHAAPAPANPSPTTGEAFLVAGALRSLRADGAPAAALAKLDEHARRFPRGILRREAALARVEALLSLGRNDTALEVLEGLSLQASGNERKVTMARAELRAERGRCPQALDDIGHLLANNRADDIAARALYGRARCELRARRLNDARTDLREYITRFPDGAQRGDVTELLRRLERP